MGLRYKCGMKRASLVGFLLALAPSSVVLAYCDTGFLIPVSRHEWGVPVADPSRPPLPEPFTVDELQKRRSPGIKGLWPGHPLWCLDFKKNFAGYWGTVEEHERRGRLEYNNFGFRADCSVTPDAQYMLALATVTYEPNGEVGLAGTLLGQKSVFKVTFEKAEVKKFTISMCEASASKIIPLLTNGSQREKDANEKVRQRLARQTIDFLIGKWGQPHGHRIVLTDKPRGGDWLTSIWKFNNANVEFYPGGLTLEVKAVGPSIKTNDF